MLFPKQLLQSIMALLSTNLVAAQLVFLYQTRYHKPMSSLQCTHLAQLSVWGGVVIHSLCYSLAAIVFFLLLGHFRVWHRRKQQGSVTSQPWMSDTKKSEVLEEGISSDREQGQERLLEVGKQSQTLSPVPSKGEDHEPYYAGLLRFSVTSGQVATIVQQQGEREDISISKMDQNSNPKISDQCSSLSSPELDDSIRKSRLTETDLIEFYHDPGLEKIWRRRVLTFTGQ